MEKDPDVDLTEYGEQLRRIVGYLRQNEICITEFDHQLDSDFFDHRVPNGFDSLSTDSNLSKESRIKDMRDQVYKKNPYLYNKIFKNREIGMIRVLRSNWSGERSVVVVGESHVLPIYNSIESREY